MDEKGGVVISDGWVKTPIFMFWKDKCIFLSSKMFPHTFGTDQSIGIFVPELNHLCYDQRVLWMWSVYDIGF